MRRLALTQHTVRCPLEEVTASVTVRTDPEACPSRRHRDVTACSLQPPTSFVLPPRIGYFADMAPAMPYLFEVHATPCHSLEMPCSRRCLAALNAAELPWLLPAPNSDPAVTIPAVPDAAVS